MKDTRIWHKLWLIVPATLILPPLGLIMLWKSPRKLRAKVSLSVVLVLVLSGAIVGGVVLDVYGLLSEPGEPVLGYDVEMDSRNRYRNPTIFPMEREVFSEVVNELRSRPELYLPADRSFDGPRVASPEQRAFEVVADKYRQLNTDDVAAIYRKVSSQISATKRSR